MLKISVPILLVGLTLLVVGMWFAVLPLFIVGGIITGAGAGLVFRGAMVRASVSALPQSSAEVMAGFFLASYVGLSLPVVGLGVALNFAASREVMLVFSVLVAVAVVMSVRSAVRGTTNDVGAVGQVISINSAQMELHPEEIREFVRRFPRQGSQTPPSVPEREHEVKR